MSGTAFPRPDLRRQYSLAAAGEHRARVRARGSRSLVREGSEAGGGTGRRAGRRERGKAARRQGGKEVGGSHPYVNHGLPSHRLTHLPPYRLTVWPSDRLAAALRRRPFRGTFAGMRGLTQDYPLTLGAIARRAEALFGDRPVVSRRA